jgi:hypothetical protein
MRTRLLTLYIILLYSSLTAYSQYYDTGQDPSSLKWLQIKSEKFKVIYPESFGKEGEKFARSLDEAYSDLSSLFPEKKFRIPVIIHNYTTQSNGYVAWAPKRMEIYPTPDQNNIPLDPYRQLALHELTHVMQMEALNSGFSKYLSFIFGQQFPGAVAALLPMWYMEGDAVFAESFLSESGRGRVPSFEKQLKAMIVENGALFKYDKMLNGSYKHNIPDHYQLGYPMVTWSRIKHDVSLWNRVLSFTANEPFTLNPVNISLRQNADLTKKKLFTQTYDSLKVTWEKDISRRKAIVYEELNPSKNGEFINYYSPFYAGKDSIIAIRTSLSDPLRFVLIRPSAKTEETLHVPGVIYPCFFSYGGGMIAWVETRPDPRWENRSFSVIKLLDLKTGKARKLKTKTRYLSVAISPDGKTLAAGENSVDNKNFMVLIDANTGEELQRISSPGNASLQHPRWADDNRKVTAIFLTDDGEGIASLSLSDSQWSVLVPPGRDDLQSAFLRNDSLFFISSSSGTDNIHLLAGNNKISALTRSRFGITDLSIKGSSLIFSDYSSAGNNICLTSIGEAGAEEIQTGSGSFLIDRIEPSSEPGVDTAEKSYNPVPYRKWEHLIGIHSWMPFYADVEEIQSDPASVRPGATIMTQNHLSTFVSSVGYEYSADKVHLFHSRITWKGWYPVIDSRIDYGYEPLIDTITPWISTGLNKGYRFSNSIYVPLSFSTGKFSQYIYPYLSFSYINRYILDKENDRYVYGQTQVTGRLFISNYYKSAMRDIYPRWAQSADLVYTFAPFDKEFSGTDLYMKTAFYFPGLIPGAGIRMRFEKEEQVFVQNGVTHNRINYPRGYQNIISRKLDFCSVDYAAPLFYPDFNVASLIYMTRIRGGVFYDVARGTDNFSLIFKNGGVLAEPRVKDTETFSSFGAELIADYHLLRIPFPISTGIQASWKNIGEAPVLRLIFNIDVYGMNIGRKLQR